MNKTNSFIRNVKRAEEAKKVLDRLRQKDPHINMRIENYHYEFVHRRNRFDYQRRTSSSHTKEVRYSEYTDRSADPSTVAHMKKAKLTRLDLILDVQYTPQASQSKTCQEHHFKREKINDTHYDFTLTESVDDFEYEILVHNGDLGEGLPWYCNTTVYWIFHLLFIGWIIRILFVNNSSRVTYTVEKVILK